MHKKVPEKKIQSCVLVEFVYEQVLKKYKKKIDLLNLASQEQTFIIIPQDCSNKSAMKTFSGPF